MLSPDLLADLNYPNLCDRAHEGAARRVDLGCKLAWVPFKLRVPA